MYFPPRLHHCIFPPAVHKGSNFSPSHQRLLFILFTMATVWCELLPHCCFDLHFFSRIIKLNIFSRSKYFRACISTGKIDSGTYSCYMNICLKVFKSIAPLFSVMFIVQSILKHSPQIELKKRSSQAEIDSQLLQITLPLYFYFLNILFIYS